MEYFGVDVSKDSLQVSDGQGSRKRAFRNTRQGIAGLLGWIEGASGQDGAHLILEPTSTYHHPLLASLGESQQPQPTPAPQADQEGLKALERHLRWLEGELQAARNRLDTAQFSPWTPQAVLDSLERTIDRLTREIESVREAINRQLEHHSGWSRQMQLLTSIPGVGRRTASLLLSEMPPVERCASAKSWVAYCGLAPETRHSGKSWYSRLSRTGTARMRAGLYLPAISALRWNPAVRELGQRLKEREKQGRVRIVACMHKLLRICFGVLKSGLPFDPLRCQPAALDR